MARRRHRPVYADGKVHLMPARCATCIFRPGNLMHLNRGRVRDMVTEAKANESIIPCHETTNRQAPQEAICRGYWDAHAADVVTLRLAQAMDIVEEISPDSTDQLEGTP